MAVCKRDMALRSDSLSNCSTKYRAAAIAEVDGEDDNAAPGPVATAEIRA